MGSKLGPTTAAERSAGPNPKRVLAGRRNRSVRKGLTAEGRQRLREAALLHRPWLHTTGPRTPTGKARSSANGRARQKGPVSVRQARADLTGLRQLLREMREARAAAGGVRA
jgi:hypothetical protein